MIRDLIYDANHPTSQNQESGIKNQESRSWRGVAQAQEPSNRPAGVRVDRSQGAEPGPSGGGVGIAEPPAVRTAGAGAGAEGQLGARRWRSSRVLRPAEG